jgi:hypothetical protein
MLVGHLVATQYAMFGNDLVGCPLYVFLARFGAWSLTYTQWAAEHQLSIDVLRYCLFPEPDLMARLVGSYFSEYNIIFPLLHRPIFERALRAKLYLSDGGFARVLLLVCAVGSRYVDDPRVLLDNGARHSAGWKWFEQAQIAKFHLLVAPTLYDMQAHCVSAVHYLVVH